VLDAPVWTPSLDSEGLLTVSVSRPDTLTIAGVPSTAAVAVTIDVSEAVRLDGRLSRRCDADTGAQGTISGIITCTLDAPAAGATESLSLRFVVDDAGQQAWVTAAQDGTGVGTSTTDLPAGPLASLTSPTTSTSGTSTG
jgi:hypothetical protein